MRLTRRSFAVFGAALILVMAGTFSITWRYLEASPSAGGGTIWPWILVASVGACFFIVGAAWMYGEASPAVVCVHRTIVVDRLVEDVFSFIADPRNDPQWIPQVRSVELLEPLRLGTKYREELMVGRKHRWFEFEVVDYQPPNSWAAATKRPEVVGGYRLSTVPVGCEVTSYGETRVNRLFAGRVRRAQGALAEATLECLKRKLNTRARTIEDIAKAD